VRLTGAEKREVIRLVEGSDLSVRQTLQELRVNRATFYTWYRRYQAQGDAGLTAKAPAARRYWNRIPPPVRQRVADAALADPERSPRELAWQLTDRTGHFLSESSVYRILKAHDLITIPAFVVISAADRFQHPTTRPNELWQTDFTYLRVVGWGWYYLSTVLDDYSRYILAWTLTTTMAATDVATTLE
jgi:transposase InsO family protein